MLKAVGVENLPLEGIEVPGSQAASDDGLEAQKAKDGRKWDVTRDELFDRVMLVGRVATCGEILLDFEYPGEDVAAGVLHHVFRKIGVDAKGLVLLLVAWKFVDEVLEFRCGSSSFPPFVVSFQTAGYLVEMGTDHSKVGVAKLREEGVG